MTLKWTERPIGTIAYNAGNTGTLLIPRDKPIRRMVMRFDINVTTGASAPTYKEDDILNIIKKVRLVMDGSTYKFNIKARMWFYREQYEKGTQPQKTNPPTAVSTTADAFVTLIADFALNVLDEHDLSALLMARRLSSLQLEIDWGVAGDIASANAPTINAASQVEVEIREVSGTILGADGKTEQNVFGIPVTEIFENLETLTIDANHTSFDNDTLAKDVVPAPANILKQCLMVIDNNGLKNNTIVTDLKVQRESPDLYRHLQRKWLSHWDGQKVEQQMETNVVGFLYLDWINKAGGGLLNNTNQGDVKYRFLIANFVAGMTIDFFTRYVTVPKVQP